MTRFYDRINRMDKIEKANLQSLKILRILLIMSICRSIPKTLRNTLESMATPCSVKA